MGAMKFLAFETGVSLLIMLVLIIIGVYGFNSGDPKFDELGNIGLQMAFAALDIVVTIAVIPVFLMLTKHFPVSPKVAITFSVIYCLYLAAAPHVIERYNLSNGTFWLSMVYLSLIPAVIGCIFFFKVKY